MATASELSDKMSYILRQIYIAAVGKIGPIRYGG